MSVQVVRALTDPSFWRQLASGNNNIERRLTVADAAEAVAAAIWYKANPAAIPINHRAKMILALDALRLPALALPTVWKRVAETNLLKGRDLGFMDVYIVGPVPGLVQRLA